MFLVSACSAMSATCFFFNDTATTEIYTLSLHDALPISTFFKFIIHHSAFIISDGGIQVMPRAKRGNKRTEKRKKILDLAKGRSEEHTSELQSRQYLVCRLLLEKK